jgi:ABC-type dipeptide/oligopeptide/nickel transport system permease subunit
VSTRASARLPLRRIPFLLLGLLVVLAGTLTATSRWNYAAQDRTQIQSEPSRQHSTGTDDLGRDRTDRMALALLLALGGAVAASALTTALGATLGTAAAFAAPLAGEPLLYLSDLLLTLPWLFLLLLVRSALPLNLAPAASAVTTFLLLGLLGWPAFARMNFARMSAMRHADWMLFARAGGLRPRQLARTHLLPHLMPLLVTQFLIYVPICIAAEANLGTMGLGIGEPLPSWGSMLLELKSSSVLTGSIWVYLPLVLLVGVLLLLESTVAGEE